MLVIAPRCSKSSPPALPPPQRKTRAGLFGKKAWLVAVNGTRDQIAQSNADLARQRKAIEEIDGCIALYESQLGWLRSRINGSAAQVVGFFRADKLIGRDPALRAKVEGDVVARTVAAQNQAGQRGSGEQSVRLQDDLLASLPGIDEIMNRGDRAAFVGLLQARHRIDGYAMPAHEREFARRLGVEIGAGVSKTVVWGRRRCR